MKNTKIILSLITLITCRSPLFAQTTENNLSSKWQIRSEVAATYFGDEKFWGNALFVSTIYNISDQWSGQMSVGYTEGSKTTSRTNSWTVPPGIISYQTEIEQHAGQNIDLNILTKLYANDKLTLKVGLGGVYRRWVITRSSSQELIYGFNDNDIQLTNAGTSFEKLNYADAQAIVDANYNITEKLGLSLNYTFQGNYITYCKVGLNIRL
jgi:hypothetical protein